jgi:hypothetical protein
LSICLHGSKIGNRIAIGKVRRKTTEAVHTQVDAHFTISNSNKPSQLRKSNLSYTNRGGNMRNGRESINREL